MVYDQYYPFEKMPLDYDYAALEPEIGEFTTFFHYNEHYLPALEKLNKLVLETPINQNISLEELSKQADKTLARAAGSVFAHELHFASLTDEKQEPSEEMKERIISDFGSMEGFYAAMKKAANEVYGSGYLWLCEDDTGRLVPIVTVNHDTPDFARMKPVYALDLWEHGYYLDRQNHRDKYIESAFERINWGNVESGV
jgi:Fe-Mn family superoxide dismutase